MAVSPGLPQEPCTRSSHASHLQLTQTTALFPFPISFVLLYIPNIQNQNHRIM